MEKLGIECKRLMAKEVKEKLKGSSYLFLISFHSMSASEQDYLRRRLKEVDASVFVVKNRVAKGVFQQLNLKDFATLLQGLTAIAWGGSDAICISKALVDFAGKHENFKIMGAYVDDELLDLNSVKRLAFIPSKEILLAQIVCGFKSPIQGLVNTLSTTVKKIVVVFDKIREKK